MNIKKIFYIYDAETIEMVNKEEKWQNSLNDYFGELLLFDKETEEKGFIQKRIG